MEVYVPYVIGSSLSAFIGHYAYSYYSTDEIEEINININQEEINKNDYDLLIGTTPVNNNKSLDGGSFKQKTQSIREICKLYCGVELSDSSTKKNRAKLFRYIKEYENIGHDNFIKNHKKRTFKNNLN
jgi:2-hydroxy-3-keto-5-methylthiopentenyl-1-phosphate phosphatase